MDTSAKQKHRPSRQARPPSGVRQSVFLFKGITDSFALCARNDIPFSYCNHRGMRSKPSSCHCEGAGVRWTPLQSRSTDRAASETAVRRVAIRFPRPVIAKEQSDCGNPFPLPLRCGCPVDTSAKQKHRPNRQARRKATAAIRFPLRVLRILSCSALRMTNRFVIANAVRQAAIFLLLFLTRNFLFNH